MKKNSAKKTTSKKAPAMAEMTMSKNDTKTMCGGGCACGCCSCGAWGLTALRVLLGVIFVAHGASKFMNWAPMLSYFTGLFGSLGTIALAVTAALELLGGIALIVGFGTRWSTRLLSIGMIVAIVWAKLIQGGAGWFGIELELMLLIGLFVIAGNGPGKYAASNACGCCSNCNC